MVICDVGRGELEEYDLHQKMRSFVFFASICLKMLVLNIGQPEIFPDK